MEQPCKCVVWDLDETVWEGVCLEGDVRPRQTIRDVLETLKHRGIVHAIASKGESGVAMRMLERHRLREFFVLPRINWLPKTTNIRDIARELNLPLDAFAFVDDDPFEREQVAHMLPDVRVYDAREAEGLPAREEFASEQVTPESQKRSVLYAEELERRAAEAEFESREDFLRSCHMELRIRSMEQRDVPRVRELMTRTHQLNTTGIVLDSVELDRLLQDESGGGRMEVAELRDRFGDSGLIGIAFTREEARCWTLHLFALSCRVMGRGVERAFMATLVTHAARRGCIELRCLFRPTGRNRMLRAMYQMSGFRESGREDDDTLVFTLQQPEYLTIPHWLSVS